MNIIKRNGVTVQFNSDKIKTAINKAVTAINENIDEKDLDKLLNNIISKCFNGIRVEEIQELVVDELLEQKKYKIAKEYISYRAVRTEKRNKKLSELYNDMQKIVLLGDRENANKNYQMSSVVRDTIAGQFFRSFIFSILPKDLAQAHRTKAIHWHDSDVEKELTNCCLINIENMLDNGTRITNTDVETPQSVGTAMNIAMQIMASVSSQQYGGNSIPNFNEVFAKYAKKNFVKNFIKAYNTKYGIIPKTDEYIDQKYFEESTKMQIDSANKLLEKEFPIIYLIAKEWTAKEIYDACQLFEYQTNSILGSASQTPFSTITFNVPTSWESEQIILSYLKVRQTGLGALKIPAIFPKLSYIVVDGYNLKEGDPYYYITQEVSKCIANTYYPDILFYSKEDYDAGKYYARMG